MASGASQLANAVVNLTALRDRARTELCDVIDSVCGSVLWRTAGMAGHGGVGRCGGKRPVCSVAMCWGHWG